MRPTSEGSLRHAVDSVIDALIKTARDPDEKVIRELLAELRMPLPTQDVSQIIQGVQARLIGYGELAPLICDANTDVLVNSPDSVWVDGAGGLQRTSVRFASEEQVRQLAVRLASSAGRRLDETQPFVDGLMPDNVRLQAAIPPVSASGSCISLRLPAARPLSLGVWNLSPSLHSNLQPVLAGAASFVISGSTGAGKTSLLRTVISAWPVTRRVVCVEDVQELNLDLPNVVSLQGRQANAEGVGAIGMSALMRHVLRMRPDSIVVGEVRGPEVAQWLLAVSSGHPGSATTVHAESAAGAIRRLLLLCELGGVPRTSAREVVSAALSYVIHVHRRGGRREVAEVVAVSDLMKLRLDD